MKKLNILWIATSLFCGGCDDFLSQTQPDELIPETTQAFSELLLEEGYFSSSMNLENMTQYMNDDIANNLVTTSNGYSDNDIQNKDFYTWQPGAVDDIITEKGGGSANILRGTMPYKYYYEGIMACNLILEYTDNSIGEEAEKDFLKGQAHTLRAFYYFNLVNLYAWPYNDPKHKPANSLGVPVITTTEIDALVFPRNTVAEVYDLIVKDIEAGTTLLDKEKRELTKYRISHLAAHVIASRIYLYMENWDKALEHARHVMESREVTDYSEYTSSTYYSKYLYKEANEDCLWFYGRNSDWSCVSKVVATTSAFCISNDLIQSYDVQGLTDKRKTYFFSLGTRDNMYSLQKYLQGTFNYQGIRTTEAYLNAVEALIEKYKQGDAGAGSEATKLLNDFRAKRYVSNGGTSTDVSSTKPEELLEIYRMERRKEFCFEGQRWFDLRRYGMPRLEKLWQSSTVTTEKYVLEEGDPMYVLDIPSYIQDLNPGLVPNESLPSQRQPEIL